MGYICVRLMSSLRVPLRFEGEGWMMIREDRLGDDPARESREEVPDWGEGSMLSAVHYLVKKPRAKCKKSGLPGEQAGKCFRICNITL